MKDRTRESLFNHLANETIQNHLCVLSMFLLDTWFRDVRKNYLIRATLVPANINVADFMSATLMTMRTPYRCNIDYILDMMTA